MRSALHATPDAGSAWARIRAVARRDVASVLRNRGIRIPLLIAPTVILVVLPILLVAGGDILAGSTTGQLSQTTGAAGLADRFTPDTAEAMTGYTGEAAWATFILQVFIAPLYLLIPLMVSTVIAADSFAGERDRRTLEALLHTPTTDRELFVAKVLASWGPAMVVSLGGFAVYSVLANILAWPVVGQIFFPTPEWWLLALVVTPATAGLGLGIMVLVSSRVQSLQAAHQFGSLVVLPVILLLIGQVSGALLFSARFVAVLGVLIWALALLLLRLALSDFNRDRLAAGL